MQHRLDLIHQRLQRAAQAQLMSLTHRLDAASTALAHLNPEATLARGYAIVRTSYGDIVNSSQQLHTGDDVSLQLGSGGASARIEKLAHAPID